MAYLETRTPLLGDPLPALSGLLLDLSKPKPTKSNNEKRVNIYLKGEATFVIASLLATKNTILTVGETRMDKKRRLPYQKLTVISFVPGGEMEQFMEGRTYDGGETYLGVVRFPFPDNNNLRDSY